jgi:N-acetylglucosamine-6-phosphate deacetylase
MSRTERYAVAAGIVFDGTAIHHDHAVLIEGPRIVALVPRRELPAPLRVRQLAASLWLAPGFIDVQVNGGGDVLFNNCPTPEGIAAMAAAHRRFGTTALLPTLITDTRERTRAALRAVESATAANPSLLGIHLEGPFISPEKPGVHDPALIRVPGTGDFDMLTSPRSGVTLVTLAPEQVPAGFIAGLTRRGIRVSLGHSMATYAQTKNALSEGLTGFTHLFNAMRPLASREPGPIAAVLETPQVWFGMIVDGEHVAPPMLRLALRGLARPMLVTDAMPPVGGQQSSFKLQGREIRVENGRCTRRDGTLAGAVLDMATAVRNCIEWLDVPLTAALRFASLEPAAFLGLEGSLGRLAPGCRADMVALDPDGIRVHATWVAGRE